MADDPRLMAREEVEALVPGLEFTREDKERLVATALALDLELAKANARLEECRATRNAMIRRLGGVGGGK